jgi:hypothetical protein
MRRRSLYAGMMMLYFKVCVFDCKGSKWKTQRRDAKAQSSLGSHEGHEGDTKGYLNLLGLCEMTAGRTVSGPYIRAMELR